MLTTDEARHAAIDEPPLSLLIPTRRMVVTKT